VVVGASESLLDSLPPSDPLCREVEAIKRSADRGVGLTRQILAFSRQQMLTPVVVNLNDVIAGMARLLQRLMGEDIELETNCAPDLDSVLADRSQLEQVILNLAINAREAMPNGGRLVIETSNVQLTARDAPATIDAGLYVRMIVRDVGVGMNAEVRAHAFEPFFTTRAPQGAGLGLSAVYGIVNQSGGGVVVTSQPSIGTTVSIYLPRSTGMSMATEPDVPPSRAEHETVLLVEDEEAVRALVCEMLELAGYSVLSADRPSAAQQICRTESGAIDLLLTDVIMPELTGPRLAADLVRLRPNLKVLYMSGYADDAVGRDGVLEPGTHLIAKPFTRQSLLQKVREVLD
jgi:CheY-like chemotaxis protein